MRPAFSQDRPARVGAVDFDALPWRDGDPDRNQLSAQLRAEEVQHDALGVTLLAGIPVRYGPGSRGLVPRD